MSPPIGDCPHLFQRICFIQWKNLHLCGAGGMHHKFIQCKPLWRGRMARCDTVLVLLDNSLHGMHGMLVAWVLLLFLFHDVYLDKDFSCALVNWFIPTYDEPDEATGMWVVEPKLKDSTRTIEVIHLDAIARVIHLLPVYGSGYLPEDFHYLFSLDSFKTYFVNHYINHHAHEFLT